MSRLMLQSPEESPGGCSISSIHSPRNLSPPFVIKLSKNDHDGSQPVSYSAVHFRNEQPAIQYRISGSQLILSPLGVSRSSQSTVLECGSNIANAGLHDDNKNLIVHIFLETHILYSMIISPAHLENPQLKRTDGWITEYSAPSFQIRSPLYMKSISATDIMFSLADGGLLRLSNNGGGYNEHIFSDSSYFSSFKSILPWSGRPANLVISMHACVERNLLFTLSVDAKLKLWDLKKGALLSVHDAHKEPLSFLLEAIPSGFLTLHYQVATVLLVTYCPGKPGIFKVFRGRGSGVDEIYSVREELPPSGMWLMFDMAISRVQSDGQIELQVLWKLDNLSLLQTGIIDLNRSGTTWSFAIDTTAVGAAPPSELIDIDEFIFTPGRFSIDTLNAALGMKPPGDDIAQIKARTAHAIKSSIELKYDEDTGNALQQQYDDEIRLKYLRLAQICKEIDRTAAEAHSITASPYTGETIISQTTKLSTVRPGNSLERCIQIAQSAHSNDSTSILLKGALLLEESLNSDSWHSIKRFFRQESINSRTLSADDAMFVAYEKTIEDKIPRATIAAIEELSLSAESFLVALHSLHKDFQPVLKGSPDGALGFDGFVANNRGAIGYAAHTTVAVLTFLVYIACSSDAVNAFRASALYIDYLSTFKTLSMINETFSQVLSDERNAEGLEVGKISVNDIADTVVGQTVFEGLATVDRNIHVTDFLERTLVFLINQAESRIATHFSAFIGSSSAFACYLQGRIFLISKLYDAAAESFARNGFPLIKSPKLEFGQLLYVKLSADTLVSYHLHIADLFASCGRFVESTRFCTEAELASAKGTAEERAIVNQALFSSSLAAQQWDEAYRAMISLKNSAENESLRLFVSSICLSNSFLLCKFPFIGMVDQVDATLDRKARSMLDVRAKPAWHKLLYAFRIQHNDHRGAAAIIYHRLQVLKNRTHVNGFNVNDHLEITEGYLLIINALRCVKHDNAWIIVGTLSTDLPKSKRIKTDTKASDRIVRKVMQLKDIKTEYDTELKNMDAQLQQLAGLAY